MSPTPLVVTHGGCGAPNDWSDGCVVACRRGLDQLQRTDRPGAEAVLAAVVEAAAALEDDPRFNAGTGSNLRIDGSIQQDAIVAASDGRMGAVACLESTRNPIRVARAVVDSPHVMLCGDGATAFARKQGFPAFDCSTPQAVERLREALERMRAGKLRPAEARWVKWAAEADAVAPTSLRAATDAGCGAGTIGAVARDAEGNFAVACSTGGTALMMRGRVGDSPIFGAGVMVGAHGAVCCTGHGEEIIRRLSASRCYQRIVQGEAPQSAADAIVAAFPAPYMIGLIVISNDGHGIACTGGAMASAAAAG